MEILEIVDKNNKIIGKATREKIHSSGLWHRGIHVLLFNKNGELILQIRSPTKDKFPNCYDCSASGHLDLGESFEQCAIRELKEELGIKNIELKKLVRIRMNYGVGDNMISEIYEGKFDGKMDINKTEINKIEFIPLDKLKELLKTKETKFAKWTREILKWFFGMKSEIELF